MPTPSFLLNRAPTWMPCEPLRAFGAEFANDVRKRDNGGIRRQLKMMMQQHYFLMGRARLAGFSAA